MDLPADRIDSTFSSTLLSKRSRYHDVEANVHPNGSIRYTGFTSISGYDLVEYCKRSLTRAVVTFQMAASTSTAVMLVDTVPAVRSVSEHKGGAIAVSSVATFLNCTEKKDVSDTTTTHTFSVTAVTSEFIEQVLRDSAVLNITLRDSGSLVVVSVNAGTAIACRLLSKPKKESQRKYGGSRRTQICAAKLSCRRKRQPTRRPMRTMPETSGFA